MTAVRRGVPDWGQVARPGSSARPKIVVACFFGAPILILLATTLLGAPPALVLAASAGYGLAVVVWVRAQGRLALATAGARRIEPAERPRLANVAAGIASDLGIARPELWLIERGGPNALVCRSRQTVLAVTASLLDSFSRTELEAVVAHCLVRLAQGQVDATQLSLSLGPFGRSRPRRVGTHEDVAAAALTRYPPALAQAVSKARPARGRYGPLWFAAEGPSHLAAAGRATALLDL